MSVEEAWAEIAHWLNAREFACLDGNYTDSLRDRLILEAQAEMPCSGRYAVGLWGDEAELSKECPEQPNLTPDFEEIPNPVEKFCPSCQARMKLKELTTTVGV